MVRENLQGTHPRYPQGFSPAHIGPVELANRYFFSGSKWHQR